ncbi:hypothetical protein F2P81_005932 [Scophthalmus maximus]|uniref:Uncharacterized protein n=1 Tax=Scophthalmus maximus TaxID=52904 RepID=A0A6A4TF65_SCOMX|nr:hypothetical protein F2P81_005932 [Scophthalmus maximus]
MHENSTNFKNSLDRIIYKYSKLQYQGGGTEVDLVHINTRTQDITRDSQLDFTYEDVGFDETCASSCQFAGDNNDDGMARGDIPESTKSSLDKSEQNISETELQPEDRDEELEMTLRRHGTSLVELYPSFIDRIERAWHRRNLSEAADSVLRKYRKWRQHSNRGSPDNTFNVTLRQTNDVPGEMTSGMLLEENVSSPEDRQFTRGQPAHRSPSQLASDLPGLRAQQPSPGRERGWLRRAQHQPVLVMDLYGACETSVPKGISLNQTFTVCELSQLGGQPRTYGASPSRHPSASPDPSLRSKRLSLTAHPEAAPGGSVYASDIYSSPVRQSPLKARMMSSLGGSPRPFLMSPRDFSFECFSREPTRPRLRSTSLSSPTQRPTVPLRVLQARDSHLSPEPRLHSPQSAKAGRPKLRRHLSFDSSLPSTGSPKTLDEDLMKLYHNFVCLNKSSFFSSHPCRLCRAKSPEASRGHYSSSLSALALSPHCSVLRKRHRELGWSGHPRSKRSRDENCTSSPGSKRHGNEMLRRHLLRPELCRDDFSCSSSQHSPQRRSADAHQAQTGKTFICRCVFRSWSASSIKTLYYTELLIS